MCGIVGILGRHEAAPILVEALKRLEYRGYDSAGIATINSGSLDRRRAMGKLVNLADLLVHDPLPGKTGIGHTRWATHGAPTVVNAHPHRAGRVAIVHNGIIENFRALREDLHEKGYAGESETDTETVALLAQSYLDQGLSPRDAAEQTIARLEGAFALAFLFDGEDDLMIGARRGSPLAVGHGAGEMFLGSDAIALSGLTDRITYLEEGDRVVLTRETCEIYGRDGRLANRDVRTIQIDATRIEKGGYRHYMMKEIAEQPTVLANTIAHYLPSGNTLRLPRDLNFSKFDRIALVACGTAHYACLTARFWFERFAGLPVDIDVASEFRYREPPIGPNTLAIFVSQSGETADTLAALRYCEQRAMTLGVVNVAESSIAREADVVLPTLAGPEIGVASTKAFTCQLTVLAILAVKAALDRGHLSQDDVTAWVGDLRTLPGIVAQALETADTIRAIGTDLAKAQDILFLGRGPMFPMALEGALKLKEISYIHAEGFASGELKHGPIALVDSKVPVIVFAPQDTLFDKTVSNMQEVVARDGKVVLVTDSSGAEGAAEGAWHVLRMPRVADPLAPILYAIPAQLLAYYTAVAKGTDVDQPRNLAKSVTVE
ncbi:MAG: glutamine--fructose-6-phosphate transaminase (isomerizing) [Pseudomonadota bacterium]